MLKKISAAQCRAARALLEVTQPELAKAANLGLSTVVDFERSRREVSDEANGKMGATLERMGVEFLDENGGGVGVRFRRSTRPTPRRRASD